MCGVFANCVQYEVVCCAPTRVWGNNFLSEQARLDNGNTFHKLSGELTRLSELVWLQCPEVRSRTTQSLGNAIEYE